ncbi:hypothetical protein JAAARDRAFT_124855 [Jaapia argillacea MUCL 33604]|uniref:Uncharacterized protein n=1 Tax=Jaapia argillacea MUCL 33604 TaxID=933084 RepID=A0A067Q0V7_9AGAM|nr:hypothetical protein JAAARDRAFT_124855 [Jaapia argillacea MUCL 33604]
MSKASSSPLPAHHTKHLSILDYPFINSRYMLAQSDDGATNGTALWLGAQCLSLYFAHIVAKLPKSGTPGRRPRVIELGSGVGLTALVLSSLGWDVLATDLCNVTATVLSRNVAQNTPQLHSGTIEIRELDWMISPEDWTWDNDEVIASASRTRQESDARPTDVLGPPFDFIITSDTFYAPALTAPLLRTLYALSVQSLIGGRGPPIYICIERRDPVLIDQALEAARVTWGFSTDRVPQKKVARAMEKGGVKWPREDWEGVEIWKMSLDPNCASLQSAVSE